jgi:DNA repair exonuclease SbcCD ATPase subunit
MIVFKQLKFKNFEQYSNQLTVIDFIEGMHLIVGKNGSGKSIILDAICYVLFGKALRKIKNLELINRINKKNMLVEIFMLINSIEYKIVRGLKPEIFEIWKNGNRFENYNKVDMQEYLEHDILKFDEKMFKQIVILGSDLHVPFLKLPLPERRFLIERLFDFDTLTKINALAKTNYKEKEKKLNELKNQNKIVYTKIESLKSEKKRIDKENEKILLNKKQNEERLDNAIKELDKEINQLKSQIGNIDFNKKVYDDKIKQIESELQKLNEVFNHKNIEINTEYDKKIYEFKSEIGKSLKIKEDLCEKIDGLNNIIVGERYYLLNNNDSNKLLEFEKKKPKIDEYKKERLDYLKIKLSNIDLELGKALKRKEFYQNNKICEVCGSYFSPVKIDEMLTFLNNEINRLNGLRIDFKNELDEIEGKKIKVKENLFKQIVEVKSLIVNNIKLEIEKLKKEIDYEITIQENNKEFIKQCDIKRDEVFKNLKMDYDNRYIKLDYDKNEILKEIREKENQIEKQKEIQNDIKLKEQNYFNLRQQLYDIGKVQLLSYEEVKSEFEKQRELYKENSKIISKKELYLKYVEKVIDMFSDKGIRSVLIQKYLPLLNTKIKEFLEEFDCDFNIEFNEMFDTIIKNRNEEIVYESYSSGQRQRMNLAILFTFMAFMKLKQGINCNLLIFDEILDSSLDEEGIEVFFRLLETFSIREKYSIFVISHRESNINYFQNILKVEKKNNFSNIERIVLL